MREAKRDAMRKEMMNANEAQIAVKAQTDLKMKAEEDVRLLAEMSPFTYRDGK